jgi:hypothetical protein
VVKREDVPVEIGRCDLIVIDKTEPADTDPRKGFRGKPADRADPDHGHKGMPELRDLFLTDQ